MRYTLILFLIIIAGCQPKAELSTIEYPMNSFTATKNDSSRGASSIEDLACYFFLSLKGELSFEELTRFIPDSANIAEIYRMTGTDVNGVNLQLNADTVRQLLQQEWIKTRSEATELKANWGDASFEELQVVAMEHQKIPSKKILLECKSGKTTLRASAKCMKIGDRWFIGEHIKFGV